MSDKIASALTAEEWASERMETTGTDSYDLSAWKEAGTYRICAAHCGCEISPQHFHILAALALHGQPFGFTREDVEALRNLVADLHPNSEPFHSLAARIEALLPPEDTK